MGNEPKRYRLKLSRLDFVSLVDDPAQPNAKTLLIKRRSGGGPGVSHHDVEATCAKFVKASDELGLAFFWAFTSTNPDGSDHFDHHGDTIDQGFIKAAMDFMLDGGGAVDEMHDGAATDARVAFAMPMTPDIAKAFSIDTKQSGLMVALKVNQEQLAKLKDGTYSGVSIAGLGIREPVAARKGSERTRKSADERHLTDVVDGHQHEVCCYEGSDAWMTSATAEGAASPHSHVVTRGEDGALTVLADSGHTHTLTPLPKVVTVDADTKVVIDDESTKRASKSPGVKPAANVVSTRKESAMDPQKEIEDLKTRIAALEAQLAEAAKTAEMTDEEKLHAAALSATEQKRFRALSKSERKVEVAKALEADPVVAMLDGMIYRKSTPGSHLAVRVAEQAAQVEKAHNVSFAKSTLSHFAGTDDERASLAALVRGIGDEPTRKRLTEILGGMNDIAKSRATAPGFDGGTGPTDAPITKRDAHAALEKGLLAFAKANNIDTPWTTGIAAFAATTEGAALVRAYNEAA